MLKNPSPLSCMTIEDNLSAVSRQCVVPLPQKQQHIIKGLPKVLCTQLPIGEAVLETRLAVASRKSSVCPAQWDELGKILELFGSVSSHYTISGAGTEPFAAPSPGLNVHGPLGLRRGTKIALRFGRYLMYLRISLRKPSSFGASNVHCISFNSELTVLANQSYGSIPVCSKTNRLEQALWDLSPESEEKL